MTLKFGNVAVNNKKFNKSKQQIALNLINKDQIVVSDKFKHSDDRFKYFIGCKKGEVVKPLCIILPEMNEYSRYFENMIKGDNLLDK